MSQPFSLSIFISFIFISIIFVVLLLLPIISLLSCYLNIIVLSSFLSFNSFFIFSFSFFYFIFLFFLSTLYFFLSLSCGFFDIFFILFWPIFWIYNWFSKMSNLLTYMQLYSFQYWSSSNLESKVNFSLRFVVPVWAILSYFGVRVGPESLMQI